MGKQSVPTRWQAAIEEIAARVKRTETKVSRIGEHMHVDLGSRNPHELGAAVSHAHDVVSVPNPATPVSELVRSIQAAGAMRTIRLEVAGQDIGFITITKGVV